MRYLSHHAPLDRHPTTRRPCVLSGLLGQLVGASDPRRAGCALKGLAVPAALEAGSPAARGPILGPTAVHLRQNDGDDRAHDWNARWADSSQHCLHHTIQKAARRAVLRQSCDRHISRLGRPWRGGVLGRHPTWVEIPRQYPSTGHRHEGHVWGNRGGVSGQSQLVPALVIPA